MSIRRVVLLALAALALGSVPAGSQSLTTLSGSVLPDIQKATYVSHYTSAKPVVVAVTMHHDLAALHRAEAALYDPSSPSYHHFLTPAQWRARYGTPPARLAAVRRFVSARGLKLVHPSRYGDYVMAAGSVAQVERTFSVQLNTYRLGGKTFFANAAAPRVPSNLGIDAVLGLESYDSYHLAGDMSPKAATQDQGGCLPTGDCTGSMSPQDLWSAYDMPANNLGQGQTIGLFGEGQTADVIKALRRFEDTRGLPHVPVQVIHTDPGDATIPESQRDDSGRIEWELDTQASSGMAPGISQLRLYFGTSLLLTEFTGSIANWVNDPAGPLQASASLGSCEDDPALHPLLGASQRADMALLTQAAMEGRTLFASTGDTGSSCAFPPAEAQNGIDYGNVPSDEYPAVDPNTVAVGGTALYTSGGAHPKITSERAWSHTGGGPSKFIAQPSYQTGASPFLSSNACVTQADGTPFSTPGQLCRGNADVAAISGDETELVDHRTHPVTGDTMDGGNGYDIVDYCPAGATGTGPNEIGGVIVSPKQACVYGADPGPNGTYTDHFSEGGTSLSSPLWVGMWARVQAHHDEVMPKTLRPVPSKSLGFANYVIYKVAQDAKTADSFHDVTLGNNPLPAAPGWDFPTGWGSPDVAKLIAAATGNGRTGALQTAITQASSDPDPIFAQPTSGAPSCNYVFYDPTGDAPDLSGSNDDQLDLVEGDMGLTPDGTKLRVVMSIADLTKNIPTGSDYLDYEFYWDYTPAGASSPTTYAVDVQVDATGAVTYADGTESITQGNYQFTPNSNSTATGTFGSGKLGKIEIDVPLSEIGNPKPGDTLTNANAYTADGLNAVVTGAGFIVDQAGPGTYKLGGPTCLK